MTVDLQQLRIGYVPISTTLDAPGDRRRFVNYARKRGLSFEIADPDQEYDLVVLTECADISVWSQYGKGKLVYDLIDSYLAIPQADIKGCLRGLAKFVSRQSRYPQLNHWKAVQTMCRRADAVVCSTEEQARDISNYCANVHIVLDSHSTVVRTVKQDYVATRPFRLVWEGLPQTLGSLELIRTVLAELRKKHSLEIHLVTDSECYRYLGRYGKARTLSMARRIFPDVHLHEWNEETCSQVICSCDVAVIPLPLADPFAAGKPENKLLLFWRMGMPVVVSATPAYERAMAGAGQNHLACKNNAQWLANLEHLIVDEAARRNVGTLGKDYANRVFSEDSLLARWDAAFASLGFTSSIDERAFS